MTVTNFEVTRALGVFQAELRASRDAVNAMRGALVDFAARTNGAIRVAQEETPKELQVKFAAVVAKVCGRFSADPSLVCSRARMSKATGGARAVLVYLFTDAGYSQNDIVSGFGISATAVAHALDRRPENHGYEAIAEEIRKMVPRVA